MSEDNPTLYGTQRDYALDAWRTACGSEDGFAHWWDSIAVVGPWHSTRELMAAAWSAAPCNPAIDDPAPLARFEAWWRQILDGQPKEKP